MADAPWLTIVGLGEDGPDGLPPASLAALETAEIIMGPPRHLSLLPALSAETVEWPVPFADGLPKLLAFRGRAMVVLASGDPFWHGAGRVITRALEPGEWTALPGPSCFSLAAARMGWALETTTCLALHAAPLTRLRPYLAPGSPLIVTLRDGTAAQDLCAYLTQIGFGPSTVTFLSALGGPREARRPTRADELPETAQFDHPLCAAIAPAGPALPLTPGRADDTFDHDGQITKSPIRALTLSALAPRPGETLWDIGGGSGSIAIEWLLAHPSLSATCFEPRPDRAARITANAADLGVDRLQLVEGCAPEALQDLPAPDAIFIGGGLSQALLDHLVAHCPGTRLVANAVTLESEALLTQAQAQLGGDLMRIDISHTTQIGPKRGWQAAYPIVQWSVTL